MSAATNINLAAAQKRPTARPRNPVIPSNLLSTNKSNSSGDKTDDVNISKGDIEYHEKLRNFLYTKFYDIRAKRPTGTASSASIFFAPGGDVDATQQQQAKLKKEHNDDEDDNEETEDENTKTYGRYLMLAFQEKLFNTGSDSYNKHVAQLKDAGEYSIAQYVITITAYILFSLLSVIWLEWMFWPLALLFCAIFFTPVVVNEILPKDGKVINRVPLAVWFGSGLVNLISNTFVVAFFFSFMHATFHSYIALVLDLVVLIVQFACIYRLRGLRRQLQLILSGIVVALILIWWVTRLWIYPSFQQQNALDLLVAILFTVNILAFTYLTCVAYAVSLYLSIIVPTAAVPTTTDDMAGKPTIELSYKMLINPVLLSCLLGVPQVVYNVVKKRYAKHNLEGIETPTSSVPQDIFKDINAHLRTITTVSVDNTLNGDGARVTRMSVHFLCRMFQWFLSSRLLSKLNKSGTVGGDNIVSWFAVAATQLSQRQFVPTLCLVWPSWMKNLFISNVFVVPTVPPLFNAFKYTSKSSVMLGHKLYHIILNTDAQYDKFLHSQEKMEKRSAKMGAKQASISSSSPEDLDE